MQQPQVVYVQPQPVYVEAEPSDLGMGLQDAGLVDRTGYGGGYGGGGYGGGGYGGYEDVSISSSVYQICVLINMMKLLRHLICKVDGS